MSELVQIYDSTLRDGAQAEGISFSAEDKTMIAQHLDAMGIHYVEGGWPNPTNPKDLEFFDRVRDLEFHNTKIVAFGSTCRVDNPPEDDPTLTTLLRAGTEAITLFGKSWTLHVTDVLRATLDENSANYQGFLRLAQRKRARSYLRCRTFFRRLQSRSRIRAGNTVGCSRRRGRGARFVRYQWRYDAISDTGDH